MWILLRVDGWSTGWAARGVVAVLAEGEVFRACLFAPLRLGSFLGGVLDRRGRVGIPAGMVLADPARRRIVVVGGVLRLSTAGMNPRLGADRRPPPGARDLQG